MRTIQKGPEPVTLTRHRQQPHADYDNYRDMDGLRAALVAEQRGVCCYCQSRIRATAEGMKVEHWQCQVHHPDRQLDYRNLLGACHGGHGRPKHEQHCDTRKSNNALCFSVPRLVSNRKAVLAAFQQRLKDGRRVDPARELLKWDGTQGGELPEFAQVMVYWLCKRLRRASV